MILSIICSFSCFILLSNKICSSRWLMDCLILIVKKDVWTMNTYALTLTSKCNELLSYPSLYREKVKGYKLSFFYFCPKYDLLSMVILTSIKVFLFSTKKEQHKSPLEKNLSLELCNIICIAFVCFSHVITLLF